MLKITFIELLNYAKISQLAEIGVQHIDLLLRTGPPTLHTYIPHAYGPATPTTSEKEQFW